MYLGTRGKLEIALSIKNDKDITLTEEQLYKVNQVIHEELLAIRNYNREQEKYKSDYPTWHYRNNDETRWYKEVFNEVLTEDEWTDYIEFH